MVSFGALPTAELEKSGIVEEEYEMTDLEKNMIRQASFFYTWPGSRKLKL